jgi:FKBP-type peptidyl-prolyl cis-trans isomerase
LIQGWHTGVVGMKRGSKRLLIVPPSLAYGSKGIDNKIPANSTNIIEFILILNIAEKLLPGIILN